MTAPTPFLCSSRMLVTIMCFLAVSMMMCFRLNMSVGIVCMVNQTYLSSLQDQSDSSNENDTLVERPNSSLFTSTMTAGGKNSNVADSSGEGSSLTSETAECVFVDDEVNNTSSRSQDGPLRWDKTVQGQVLGAYFYGYVASQIPAGWAVRKLGGKNLILAGLLSSTAACLLIPIVALHSVVGVLFLRVLFGLLGGLITPAAQTIISNWSPPSERSIMGSFTFAGFPCGTLVAFSLAGLMCQYGFAGGWPSVFYLFGIIGVLFSLSWALLVSETPELHRRISPAERDYIDSSLQGSVAIHKHQLSVPWKSLMTSLPVYAVIVSGTATDFVANIFLMFMPTYLSEVMHFNISSNGLISSLPFIFCFVTVNIGGYVSNLLIKYTSLSTGTVRKLCSGFGKILCIASLVSVGFIDCHQPLIAVALLVVSVGGVGFMTIGYFVNPLDIAPEYSGLIIGIASTVANVSGFVSATFVGAIMSQGSTRQSWQLVFLISAGVVIAGLLFHIIFASGEIQPWAKPPPEHPHQNNEIRNEEENEAYHQLVDMKNSTEGHHSDKII